VAAKVYMNDKKPIHTTYLNILINGGMDFWVEYLFPDFSIQENLCDGVSIFFPIFQVKKICVCGVIPYATPR